MDRKRGKQNYDHNIEQWIIKIKNKISAIQEKSEILRIEQKQKNDDDENL